MDGKGDYWVERSKTMRRVTFALMILCAVVGLAAGLSMEVEPLWVRIMIGVAGAVMLGFAPLFCLWLPLMVGEALFQTIRDWKRSRNAKAIAYEWLRFGGSSVSEIGPVKRLLESAPNNREAQLLLQLIREREELDSRHDK